MPAKRKKKGEKKGGEGWEKGGLKMHLSFMSSKFRNYGFES